MGEVYRARDTRLGRDVALKVLPARSRTIRSGWRVSSARRRLLASLNHPNIAAIYGLEEAEGVRASGAGAGRGQTLAERLAPAAAAVDEALRDRAQIAEALEAAHEKGISTAT